MGLGYNPMVQYLRISTKACNYSWVRDAVPLTIKILSKFFLMGHIYTWPNLALPLLDPLHVGTVCWTDVFNYFLKEFSMFLKSSF